MASERQITVGGVPIGGGAPVVVQSMTLTNTHDVEATMAQIATLASAGCEVVRVAVPKTEDAEALTKLVYLCPLPIIADIHFNASLALKAIDAGVAAVRINPGNIGGPDKVAEVVTAAKAKGIPMRIGANSGSLPKHLVDARAAGHRRRRSSRRRSSRCGCSSGSTTATSRSRSSRARVPTMIRAYRMLSEQGALPAPPRRDRGRARRSPARSRARSASARCSWTGSATRSASRSPPTRSRRSRSPGRSSSRSACASAGR